MITTIILSLINGFIYALFYLFPTGSFPISISQTTQTAYSYSMAFDRYLPITEWFSLFTIVIGIYFAIYGYKIIIFIFNWLRGR